MNPHLPVAVIGAGPVGLAAAAHLADRGENFIVLESGPAIGHAIRQWGHVRVFSPWRYNVDRVARKMLEAAGWRHPDFETLPFGRDIVARYLEPLAFSFLREVRLAVDPWLEATDALAPLIDPNLHSCGTVRPHGAAELTHPERNFYIAGMKAYGRAPTFLLATGYEQVRSVVAALAGDHESAARVELELPATGVCRATPELQAGDSTVCCGEAPKGVDACCLTDAKAKAAGDAGCGCSNTLATVHQPATNACCKP